MPYIKIRCGGHYLRGIVWKHFHPICAESIGTRINYILNLIVMAVLLELKGHRSHSDLNYP